jgi:hypothetical protein
MVTETEPNNWMAMFLFTGEFQKQFYNSKGGYSEVGWVKN